MAHDDDDLAKRLQALQSSETGAADFNEKDLNQRLEGLQSFQKQDVDPHATTDDLWNRFNQIQADNVHNDFNPYKAPLQMKQPGAAKTHSKLAEHQTDALLNQMADEVYLEKSSAAPNDGMNSIPFLLCGTGRECYF